MLQVVSHPDVLLDVCYICFWHFQRISQHGSTPFLHQTLPFHTSLQEESIQLFCNSITVLLQILCKTPPQLENQKFSTFPQNTKKWKAYSIHQHMHSLTLGENERAF
jgi:hypothetical protein